MPGFRCLQMYEHPQNVLLVKLINANLDLLAVHKEAAAGASAGLPRRHALRSRVGSAGAPAQRHLCWTGVGCRCKEAHPGTLFVRAGAHKRRLAPTRPTPPAEETAQAQLGKSLRLWLDLQNSLNALIDSNSGSAVCAVPLTLPSQRLTLDPPCPAAAPACALLWASCNCHADPHLLFRLGSLEVPCVQWRTHTSLTLLCQCARLNQHAPTGAHAPAADNTHGVSGIKQQLEKKEGLFRKNMMGKRVNFAARSGGLLGGFPPTSGGAQA